MTNINSVSDYCYIDSPLNPLLFQALHLAFPDQVEQMHIKGAGQRRIEQTGLAGQNLPPSQYGEEYVLSCPFCCDHRKRMSVSYTYDPGHTNYRWHCHHEQCYKQRQYRTELANRLQNVWAQAKQLLRARSMPLSNMAGTTAESTPIVTQLPAGYVLLTQLPSDHQARRFLESRGFNVEDLATRWRVGYTSMSVTPSPTITDRVVIPILWLPTATADSWDILGWQAREISIDGSQADGAPKYLTLGGMQKSQMLYTAPYGIQQSDRLIVVEGVTDAWRCGEDAVAILGKTASTTQIRLIVDAAQHRRFILVAIDADADAQRIIAQLQSALSQRSLSVQVRRCRPPGGRKDFGECTADETQQALGAAMLGTRIRSRSHNQIVPRIRIELTAGLVEKATSQPATDLERIEQQVSNLGMTWLLEQIEEPLLPVVAAMEQVGLLVDQTRLSAIAAENPSLQQNAEALRRAVNPDTGRVHTLLNVMGSKTGRITSSGFALQNLNRGLRRAIVADPGRILVCADFSQFDWRTAAAMSGDTKLLAAFADPQIDIYRFAALCCWPNNETRVSTSERDAAKRLMMKYLFTLRVQPANRDEAQLWRRLREEFPALVAWRETLVEVALRTMRVRSQFGRLMALDDIKTFRESRQWQAISFAIQGTASDVFKLALLRVARTVPAETRILLPHHDSILVDTPFEQVQAVHDWLRTVMQAPPTGCPISFPVRIRSGETWEACTSDGHTVR